MRIYVHTSLFTPIVFTFACCTDNTFSDILHIEYQFNNYKVCPRMCYILMSVSLDLDAEVKKLTEEYESEAYHMNNEEKKSHLSKIWKNYDQMKVYSDEKVQLAVQMYEMVRM